MSQELIYTSVPRGLKPGSSGFCTVAMSEGMPQQWAERLEMLSGYRPVFPLGHPSASLNPVNWAHWRITIGGRTRSVLSRVAFAGADYSQRSNKFAHHLTLEPDEQPPGGPAWLMMQEGVMRTAFLDQPTYLPVSRPMPNGDRPPAVCKTWEAVTGDAGWAGVLADAFRTDPAKPAYIIFAPGVDLLPLFAEAMALLPAPKRWQVTFCTYFAGLPAGVTCCWRGIPAGSGVAAEIGQSAVTSTIVDLTKQAVPAPSTALAQAARNGVLTSELEDAHDAQPPANVHTLSNGSDGFSIRRLSRGTRSVLESAVLEDGPEDNAVSEGSQTGAPSASKWLWPTVAGSFVSLALGIGIGLWIGMSLPNKGLAPAASAAISSGSSVPPSTEESRRAKPQATASPLADTTRPKPQADSPIDSRPAPQPIAAGPHRDTDTAKAARSIRDQSPRTPASADPEPATPPAILDVGPVVVGALPDPMVMKVGIDSGTQFHCSSSRQSASVSVAFPNAEKTCSVQWKDESVTFTEEATGNTVEIYLSRAKWLNAQQIATVRAGDGQVSFSWEQTAFRRADLQELAGTVRDVLSASILSLASDSSSDSVLLTFATPKVLREPEDPQYHTFEKLVPIPGSLSRIVRLQTPTVAGGKWSRQSSTDGGRARYKAPFGERGLEFEINLVLDPKTPDQVRITRSWLSTSWPGFLPDKLAKLLDDQQKAKKTLDELPDNASDDRKSKAQENYRSLSDSIRDCKGEIAMYSQIVDLKADLILPNKVVLAEIVVPKPPVASPDAKSGH